MINVSVIFPAYNEVDRIKPTLEAFDNVLAKEAINYELLVVDDGSTDGTAAFVETLRAIMPNIRLVSSPTNKGKGNAVRLGMLAAKGNIRVMSDADGATPPDQLMKFIQPILDGTTDITIGSRYADGAQVEHKQPLYRRVWSRFSNKIIRRILHLDILDTQCGFKAFRAEVAQKLFASSKINGWSFDLEILALAQAHQYKIDEIAVRWIHDERSKGKISHLPKTVAELFKIHRNLKKMSLA